VSGLKHSSAFAAGEWVQVRSKDEILRTLDATGQVDGLPFMPEMLQFCGQRLRVFKRAHKTCDPPSGLRGRRMPQAVHLEDVRCDGGAHGGCQAGCLIFWKDAWLKKANDAASDGLPGGARPEERARCTEQDVLAGTRRSSEREESAEATYVCQSTQLPVATVPLGWWDLRQYVEDYASGNVRLSGMLASAWVFLYETLATSGLGLRALLLWMYDAVQRVRGGTPYPHRTGRVPKGNKTPEARLDLQPGELVRVRSYEEILGTLDETGHNRGMYFDAEMVPYCGGTYRVRDRVARIINEKTGKMQHLKNECLVLDNVVCRACYARYRWFCPRSIYSFWREIWLERVGTNEPARQKVSG
jgi:hypothetical protein